MSGRNPDISIILPVYNEHGNLAPLLTEINQALTSHAFAYEVIAIDDGSNDGSGDQLDALAGEYPQLRVVRFRRNFGQSAAFDVGFRRATAPIIVTLDADGQNNPADIPRMVELLKTNALDCVFGIRANRTDSAVSRKLPSKIANFIIRAVTHTNVRDLGCSLKVYRADLAKELRLYGEMHRFIAVLFEGAGARVGQVDVDHRPRTRGQSKYGLSRTFKVLFDLVTVWFMRGFQTSPIYAFGTVSGSLMCIAIALAGFVLFQKWFHEVFVHRNPLFILSMVMALMSIQFLAMGVIAELLIRTYFEARGKPAYLIKSEHGVEQQHPVLTVFSTTPSPAARSM